MSVRSRVVAFSRKHVPHYASMHAGDDSVSNVENSVGMYEALQNAGITTELHIYSAGEHGFGVRKSTMPVSTWTNRCIDWLRSLGVLKHEHN